MILDAIHIKMDPKIHPPHEYTYCGKRIRDRLFIAADSDFKITNRLLCQICVDEWENEDTRMKTPQKINDKIQN